MGSEEEPWRAHSWSDVTPLEQNDGDNPVCMIAYTPQCINYHSFIH